MKPLKILYRNAEGDERIHTLLSWSEAGHYITGYSEEAKAPRTFLKFRVQAYLDDSSVLLSAPQMPPPPRIRERAPKDDRPRILFTGFPSVQRAVLEQRAEEAGLRVVKGIALNMAFLCCGPTAGPTKLQAAREQGSIVLRQDEFLRLCETGEIPEPRGEADE